MMRFISSLAVTLFLFASLTNAAPTEAEIASDGDWEIEEKEDACTDSAEQGEVQCREWAWFGECEKNSAFMSSQCRKSCNLCTPLNQETPKCEDAFPKCSHWASLGRCNGLWEAPKGEHTINNAYVVEFCPKSCNVCDINLDIRDVNLHLGFPQTAPDMDEPFIEQRVKAKVAETRKYIQSLDPYIREPCKLGHINCARMALSPKACEENADHYVYKYLCASACQTCERFTDPEERVAAVEHFREALDDYKGYVERQKKKARQETMNEYAEVVY